MKRSVTGGNVEVANTPRGASVAVRAPLPFSRPEKRAFTVRWDPYEKAVSITKGYIAALKICPDNSIVIPRLPEIDPDKTGSVDDNNNLIFPGSQFANDQAYDVIAIINADPEKGNFITIKETSDDETSDEIEECQRYFKIAKFTIKQEGGDRTIHPDDIEQIWESDIIMPWEDLSDECCSEDEGSDESSGDDGSGDSLESDGSDDSDDEESDDSDSDSAGSAGCICPRTTELQVYPRVVEVGNGGYLCFSTGGVEYVWLAVDVILPKTITCDAEFGDLTGALFKMSFTNSAQEWWGFNKLDYFMYPLNYGPSSTPNQDIIGTLVKVPASCGQWKILQYWIEIQKGSTVSGTVKKQFCSFPLIPIKMPGILFGDEICSTCGNESDGSFD